MTTLICNGFYHLQKKNSLPPLSIYIIFLLIASFTPCYVTAKLIENNPKNISFTHHKIESFPSLEPGDNLNDEIKFHHVTAQRGKSDVLRYLKNIHYNDKSNIHNYSKTEFWYWYEKAARQGDAESQFNLGYMYLQGKGVSHDYAKARYWFELSSNQSDSVAKYFLGILYYEGKGVNKNIQCAKILFQQSCSEGLSSACHHLAIIKK